jgi:hypothetical protein
MKVFRTISALLLAVLVLVSSTSFMIGMHFCMGEVQNVSFFGKAASCEKEQSLPPCHRHEKVPCCEDETVMHRGDDFKDSNAHHHSVAPVGIDIERPHIFIAAIIPSDPLSRVLYYDYDPPLRSFDITIGQQVFRI